MSPKELSCNVHGRIAEFDIIVLSIHHEKDQFNAIRLVIAHSQVHRFWSDLLCCGRYRRCTVVCHNESESLHAYWQYCWYAPICHIALTSMLLGSETSRRQSSSCAWGRKITAWMKYVHIRGLTGLCSRGMRWSPYGALHDCCSRWCALSATTPPQDLQWEHFTV